MHKISSVLNVGERKYCGLFLSRNAVYISIYHIAGARAFSDDVQNLIFNSEVF